MKKKKHVIVIGGGASGIVAAISAKRNGADVTLLERNSRVGKKILATGNGRCNLTNINSDISFYNGQNSKFIYSTFGQFGIQETLSFFEKLGIEYKVEGNGKVFPMSDQSSSVLDVLLYELNHLGVLIITDCYATELKKNKETFIVKSSDNKTFLCDSIVFATGGKSMPTSGSDGNGYELIKKINHTIVPVFPSLVQLILKCDFLKRIDGVKFVGRADLMVNKKSCATDRGDILFTSYGISGPPILQLSRKAGEFLQKNKECYIRVSILDTMTEDEIQKRLERRFEDNSYKTIFESMIGLVNKRLISIILLETNISNQNRLASTLTKSEKKQIASLLKKWDFQIIGTKGWNNSQATAGGVNTNEVYSDTLESKKVEGLFFSGEVLDIDGQCGGFNLQWAWSSGMIAGKNAAIL